MSGSACWGGASISPAPGRTRLAARRRSEGRTDSRSAGSNSCPSTHHRVLSVSDLLRKYTRAAAAHGHDAWSTRQAPLVGLGHKLDVGVPIDIHLHALALEGDGEVGHELRVCESRSGVSETAAVPAQATREQGCLHAVMTETFPRSASKSEWTPLQLLSLACRARAATAGP